MCAAIVISTLSTLHAIEALWFRNGGGTTLLQGRYALMALPALPVLAAVVIPGLFPRVRPAQVLWTLAVGGGLLHVLSLWVLTERFYL